MLYHLNSWDYRLGVYVTYRLKCNYFIFPDIHNQKSYSQLYKERTVATNISKDEDLKTFSVQQKIAKSCIETSENKQKSIKPQEEFGLKSRMGIWNKNQSKFIKICNFISD